MFRDLSAAWTSIASLPISCLPTCCLPSALLHFSYTGWQSRRSLIQLAELAPNLTYLSSLFASIQVFSDGTLPHFKQLRTLVIRGVCLVGVPTGPSVDRLPCLQSLVVRSDLCAMVPVVHAFLLVHPDLTSLTADAIELSEKVLACAAKSRLRRLETRFSYTPAWTELVKQLRTPTCDLESLVLYVSARSPDLMKIDADMDTDACKLAVSGFSNIELTKRHTMMKFLRVHLHDLVVDLSRVKLVNSHNVQELVVDIGQASHFELCCRMHVDRLHVRFEYFCKRGRSMLVTTNVIQARTCVIEGITLQVTRDWDSSSRLQELELDHGCLKGPRPPNVRVTFV